MFIKNEDFKKKKTKKKKDNLIQWPKENKPNFQNLWKEIWILLILSQTILNL